METENESQGHSHESAGNFTVGLSSTACSIPGRLGRIRGGTGLKLRTGISGGNSLPALSRLVVFHLKFIY